MYRKIIAIVVFMLVVLTLSYGKEISIKKELGGFSNIVEIKVQGERIYVMDFDKERIKTYNFELDETGRINVERRYLRDFVVDGKEIYGAQSLGLFRIYPAKKTINEDTAGIIAFEKEGDYFYIVRYTKGLDKYKLGEKEGSYFEEGQRYLDVAVGNYVYLLGEKKLIVLDKNLSKIKERAVLNDPQSISLWRDYVIVTGNKSIDVFEKEDLYLKEEIENKKRIRKAYFTDGRVVMFNSTHILIGDNPLKVVEKKEEKKEVNETVVKEKNESKEDKEKIVYQSSLGEDYSYVYNLVYIVIFIALLLMVVVVLIVKENFGKKGKKKYSFKGKRR